MLLTGKSPNLYPITMEDENGKYLQAYPRLCFKRNVNNKIGLKLHFPKQLDEVFNKPFYGYEFSSEERSKLINTGNLGKVVELTHPHNGSTYPCFVSMDSLTNKLFAMVVQKLKIPDSINGKELNKEQKSQLREGKMVHIENMKDANQKPFSGVVQSSAEKLGLEIMSEYNIRLRNHTIDIPTDYKGQSIPPGWQEDLYRGKTVGLKLGKSNSHVSIRMNFYTEKVEEVETEKHQIGKARGRKK